MNHPAEGDDAAAAARLKAWLPPEWHLVASLRGAWPGCHVLTHPARGALLLDLAPEGTPDAEARLGRTLTAAALEPGPPTGHVWYVRLDAARLPRFAGLLREALATQPAAATPRTQAWTGALRTALRADPAWLVEPAPAAVPRAGGPAAAPPRPRARRRVMLGAAALCAIALPGLGLVLGPAAPPAPAAGTPEGGTVLAAMTVVHTPTVEARTLEAVVAPGEMSLPGPAPDAEAPRLLAGMPATPAPVEAPSSASPSTEERAPAAAAPLPVVLAPASATRPAAPRRPPPVPDRRCAEAQFRWQQGERLSWSEMAYVREGCVTGARR